MSNRLTKILEAAVAEGFLTKAVAANGVEHSLGFLQFGEHKPFIPKAFDIAIDLGTGGGLPGLVLAAETSFRWVLVERRQRRCWFLNWAVRELGLEARVEVMNMDARHVARSSLRGQALLVTARSFGSPAATAEIGAALLKVGGTLVVSEPPIEKIEKQGLLERWPSMKMMPLGLVDSGCWHNGQFGYQALTCRGLTSERFPRAEKAMGDRPMF